MPNGIHHSNAREIYKKLILKNALNQKNLDKYSIQVKDFEKDRQFINDLFAKYKDDPSVAIIDTIDASRYGEVYRVGTPEEAYYQDSNHLSNSGIKKTEHIILDYFKKRYL